MTDLRTLRDAMDDFALLAALDAVEGLGVPVHLVDRLRAEVRAGSWGWNLPDREPIRGVGPGRAVIVPPWVGALVAERYGRYERDWERERERERARREATP